MQMEQVVLAKEENEVTFGVRTTSLQKLSNPDLDTILWFNANPTSQNQILRTNSIFRSTFWFMQLPMASTICLTGFEHLDRRLLPAICNCQEDPVHFRGLAMIM